MTDPLNILKQAWEEREGPAVLATVDADGLPNIIYVGDLRFEPDTGFVMADNYFCKTRENIRNGVSRGAVLFLTKDKKAYQAKGTLEYHTDGPVFDAMQIWHMQQHPGHAAAVLRVENLYSGAEQLI